MLIGERPLWRQFLAYAAVRPDEWLPHLARTADEAIRLAREFEFCGIVTEAQLNGTHGVELLDELMKLQPDTARIIVSDLSDAASTLQCVGKAHRHLAAPCSLETLVEALNQSFVSKPWLPNEAVQRLIPEMRWVPSPPQIYFEVVSEMQSPDASLERVGEIISRDPAISAKLLQLANSAVFGLQLQVVQPAEAVAYVGLDTTRSLLLLAHTFASFENLQPAGFHMEALWRHSLAVGQFAKTIVERQDGSADLAGKAFTAGLLHDLGKLLYAANLPKQFTEALRLSSVRGMRLWQIEQEIFGACHGQIGAGLMSIWGLPTEVIEAIALHHSPLSRAEAGFNALTAVHVADAIEHECNGHVPDASSLVDHEYLHALGLENRVAEWREECAAQFVES